MTKSERARKQALRTIKNKQNNLLSANISVGQCKDCTLNELCKFSNSVDVTCRAVDFAIKEFNDFVYKYGIITPADTILVRSLGSLWGSVILAEMYFQYHGSIVRAVEGGSTKYHFSLMYNQYLRLLEKLQQGLDKLGLSPAGRQRLCSGLLPAQEVATPLMEYIDNKYGSNKTEATGKHSRFLQGSTIVGSPSLGNAGSIVAGNVCSADDQEPAGAISLDDWGEIAETKD